MARAWLPWLVAVVGAVVLGGIGYHFAGDDIHQMGDWRGGAGRFIGMLGAIGAFGGYLVTARLTRGPRYSRDGFTLSYKRIEPKAAGYREIETLRVSELLDALRAVGYEPRAEACNAEGTRLGPLDDTTALAGTNVAISDPRVRGWIRVQLPVPLADQPRALGLVEIWSERGLSAEELALFTMRSLDRFVGDLQAARESSKLSEDPVSLVTAGLGERPVHR
jgi:hypothetical protein